MSTSIEWTEDVANPTTGCDRVSPGCDHCYAMTMAKRLKGMGQPKYQRDGDPKTSGPGFGLTEHADVFAQMLRRKKPARVFLNSMSDIFHAEVSDGFIARTFAAMALTPHVTYQVLTKRHARMRSLLSSQAFEVEVKDAAYLMSRGEDPAVSGRAAVAAEMAYAGYPVVSGLQLARAIPWPLRNVWLGVSAEDQQWADIRIPALLGTPAAVRWVSAEPLLGMIDMNPFLYGEDRLDWVVLGGESGPGARPLDLHWIGVPAAACLDARVPVLVKQLGSAWARDIFVGGRSVYAQGDTHGSDMEFWPRHLQIRQYPEVAS